MRFWPWTLALPVFTHRGKRSLLKGLRSFMTGSTSSLNDGVQLGFGLQLQQATSQALEGAKLSHPTSIGVQPL